MLFEESLDGWSEYGISCFRCISRCTRYFGKHVTTTFIAASVVRNGRCLPTDRIVYTASLTLVHYLHEGLDGTQTAWESAIGVGVNQHFVNLIDGHACLQCLYKGWFQVLQISFSRIGCHGNDSLFPRGKHLVCFGIAAFGFTCGFTILFIVYRREPHSSIVLRIGCDGDVGKPTVRCCPVPMLHIGSYLHDVARKQTAGRLSFLLIVADTCGGNQELSCLVRVPAVTASRLEGDVCHRDIQFFLLTQRCKPYFSGEIGIRGKFLAQRIGLTEGFCTLCIYCNG